MENPIINAGILEKVQDEVGNSIENWGILMGLINGIGNFKAGEGYLVQVNQDGVLTIPANINNNAVSIQTSVSDNEIINGFTAGNPIKLSVFYKNKSAEFQPKSELIEGKQLMIHQVQSKQEVLDVSSQPAGMYLVKIISGDRFKVKKLFIN